MIVHPISNRALLLAYIIPQIRGIVPDNSRAGTWIFLLRIYIALVFGALALWNVLGLDKATDDNARLHGRTA